jgi:hypothetical protein
MPIHRLIQKLSFNQHDIERLAEAHEDALQALAQAKLIGSPPQPPKLSDLTASQRFALEPKVLYKVGSDSPPPMQKRLDSSLGLGTHGRH